MTTIPRRAVDGIVRHPLSGVLEFATMDRGLAEKVALTLDEHNPVTTDYVYELYASVPAGRRGAVEWVMPRRVMNALRQAALPRWYPSLTGDPELLLGRPIVVDDSAEGLTVRIGVHA